MSKTNPNGDMLAIAKSCIETAKKKGAGEAAARAYRSRRIQLEWRDGKPEKVQEATTRGVSLQLFVDGRYSTISSSDLRPEALETFIGDSITLARTLAVDPHRGLPDPKLYEGQAKIDLQLNDPKYAAVSPDQRRRIVREIEETARSVEGNEAIISVTAGFTDTLNESWLVTSNGFSGSRQDTSFWISASASVKDADGRRPEDYSFAGARFFSETANPAEIGRDAAQRALSRLGSTKSESGTRTLVIDARAAGRVIGALLGPMSGAALQQKRSFLEGKKGEKIGSDLLTFTDDPLIPSAFGSRHYDGEGLAARALPIFREGVLQNYYIDTYYAKKLGVAPTTGGASNLSWKLGEKNREALIAAAGDAILVTGFLGGNSNGLTGDYSLGIQGFAIRDGKIAEPVSEINISGNMLELWQRLVAVGNDPYPYSSLRTPTLVFEGVSVAGS
jgi:PmbA protein